MILPVDPPNGKWTFNKLRHWKALAKVSIRFPWCILFLGKHSKVPQLVQISLSFTSIKQALNVSISTARRSEVPCLSHTLGGNIHLSAADLYDL